LNAHLAIAFAAFAFPYHLFKNHETLKNWKLNSGREKMFKVERERKKELKIKHKYIKMRVLIMFCFFFLLPCLPLRHCFLKTESQNTS
jgi:hypothetical protein